MSHVVNPAPSSLTGTTSGTSPDLLDLYARFAKNARQGGNDAEADYWASVVQDISDAQYRADHAHRTL